MTFAEKMKGLAKDAHKHLVLPEGLEPRTVRAARIIADEGIAASVTLIGNEAEVRANAEKLGVSPVIKSYLDTKAMDMLNLGDVQGHDARLAALARTATDADVIVLAQASMATAANLVREATGKKVLTSPGSCIEDIKAALAK